MMRTPPLAVMAIAFIAVATTVMPAAHALALHSTGALNYTLSGVLEHQGFGYLLSAETMWYQDVNVIKYLLLPSNANGRSELQSVVVPISWYDVIPCPSQPTNFAVVLVAAANAFVFTACDAISNASVAIALDVDSLGLVWKTPLSTIPDMASASDDVIVFSGSATVQALAAATGEVLWNSTSGNSGSMYYSTFVGKNVTLTTCSFPALLFAVDTRSGAVMWTLQQGYPILVDRDVVIATASNTGSLVAVHLHNGSMLWQYRGVADITNAQIAVSVNHTRVVAVVPYSSYCYEAPCEYALLALDMASGALSWFLNVTSEAQSLFGIVNVEGEGADDETVVAAFGGKYFVNALGINASSGKVRFNTTTNFPALSDPSAVYGYVAGSKRLSSVVYWFQNLDEMNSVIGVYSTNGTGWSVPLPSGNHSYQLGSQQEHIVLLADEAAPYDATFPSWGLTLS